MMVVGFWRAAAVVCGLAWAPQIAWAQDAQLLEKAFGDAVNSFERALPRLGSTEFGVDVAAYRDALTVQRFASGRWGGTVKVVAQIQEQTDGSCGKFAAFTRVPPQDGVVPLVLCPQFFKPGADSLRELTILHEMVHVVAGTDECQAMAFAAKVQQASGGQFTPVAGYWQASGCAGSAYRLPE